MSAGWLAGVLLLAVRDTAPLRSQEEVENTVNTTNQIQQWQPHLANISVLSLTSKSSHRCQNYLIANISTNIAI
jgi:hypothetical protein